MTSEPDLLLDSRGRVRKARADEQKRIDALSPERREIFDRVTELSAKADAARDHVLMLEREETAGKRALKRAEDKLLAKQPTRIFHDVWKEQMASQYINSGRPVPPHLQVKKLSDAEAALLSDLTKDVAEARNMMAQITTMLAEARNEHKATMRQQGKAIQAWLIPMTPLENVRQHLATSQLEKQAVADGRRITPAPQFQSVLDATAYHMKGGNARRGGGNAFRRGAAPASYQNRRAKLPSDR